MKFYKRAITKRSRYFKQALQLLKDYRVRGYFSPYHGHREALPIDSKIYVGMLFSKIDGGNDKNDCIQSFLSGVCHELGHVLNYRNKKYYIYHKMGSKTRFTKKLIKNWIRTGYKAEKYTDKVGTELMKKHFPGIPYLLGYPGRHGYLWYQRHYVDDLKKFLQGEITYND